MAINLFGRPFIGGLAEKAIRRVASASNPNTFRPQPQASPKPQSSPTPLPGWNPSFSIVKTARAQEPQVLGTKTQTFGDVMRDTGMGQGPQNYITSGGGNTGTGSGSTGNTGQTTQTIQDTGQDNSQQYFEPQPEAPQIDFDALIAPALEAYTQAEGAQQTGYEADVKEIESGAQTRKTGAETAKKAIENNLVVSYLKTKGYKYLHFGAQSFTTAENKNADFTYVYMTRGITSDRFMKLFLDQVLLKPINLSLDSLTYSLFLNSASLDPRRIKYETQFDQLEKVVSKVESKSPKFVFLHSLLTHPPYVIDTNGAYVPESLEASKGVKEKYINQLAYSNKLLKQAIETILAKSKTPPVIILQADEGPYPEIYLMKEDKINWQNADKDALQEKFGILNAYYLPEVGNKMLYPKITPVNTFRVIFNQYFKEDFPLLEDRSYVPLAFSYPYNLFDLTNQLK